MYVRISPSVKVASIHGQTYPTFFYKKIVNMDYERLRSQDVTGGFTLSNIASIGCHTRTEMTEHLKK